MYKRSTYLLAGSLFLLAVFMAPAVRAEDALRPVYARASLTRQPSMYRFGFQPDYPPNAGVVKTTAPVTTAAEQPDAESPDFSTMITELRSQLLISWHQLSSLFEDVPLLSLFKPSIALAEPPVAAPPPRVREAAVERQIEKQSGCYRLVCDGDREEAARHDLFLNAGEQLERF